MVSMKDLSVIKDISKKYNVEKVLLFGSSLEDGEQAGDIDIAVSGIKDDMFYRYYGEMIIGLSKPVDIVNLADNNGFSRLISKEGTVVYG